MKRKGSPRRGLRTVEPGVLTPGDQAEPHTSQLDKLLELV
jgi:hypothetical protein